MSRIRSIHPGLFTDEDYMSLSPLAMAAWPGVWIESDDNGVFEWKPLTLKAKLLPCASVDMTAILAEYEQRGMIRQFEVDGKRYGAVRNFRKFQRPEKPKAWHPLPDELLNYVGLDGPDHKSRQPVAEPSPTIPVLIVDQSPTVPRKMSQMEDGGWRMEEIVPFANANGPRPPPEISEPQVKTDPKTELFRRGKEILGKNSGGFVQKILLAKNQSIPMARAALEQASTMADPKEYLGAIVRGRERTDDEAAARLRGDVF